jgi:hypothetical protein
MASAGEVLLSFNDRPQDRATKLAAIGNLLKARPLRGQLLILVTHQVTITALAGELTASGRGVLAALDEGGALRTAERLGFGG